jgi:hypothetical protein
MSLLVSFFHFIFATLHVSGVTWPSSGARLNTEDGQGTPETCRVAKIK